MAFTTIADMLTSLNSVLAASVNKDDRVEEAKLMVSECTFGTKYNLAVALYAMHLLSLDDWGSGTDAKPNTIGVIAEEREDRLTLTYRNSTSKNTTSEEWFRLTSFGARFLILRNSRIFMPRVRSMGC